MLVFPSASAQQLTEPFELRKLASLIRCHWPSCQISDCLPFGSVLRVCLSYLHIHMNFSCFFPMQAASPRNSAPGWAGHVGSAPDATTDAMIPVSTSRGAGSLSLSLPDLKMNLSASVPPPVAAGAEPARWPGEARAGPTAFTQRIGALSHQGTGNAGSSAKGGGNKSTAVLLRVTFKTVTLCNSMSPSISGCIEYSTTSKTVTVTF
jgi:hypothetical protein